MILYIPAARLVCLLNAAFCFISRFRWVRGGSIVHFFAGTECNIGIKYPSFPSKTFFIHPEPSAKIRSGLYVLYVLIVQLTVEKWAVPNGRDDA